MLAEVVENRDVYLFGGYTDLRKGIQGLTEIVCAQGLELYTGSMFLFCGRSCRKMKIVVWDENGFALIVKRVDYNGRFHWPRGNQETYHLTTQQVKWLLEGLEIQQKNAITPIKNGALF